MTDATLPDSGAAASVSSLWRMLRRDPLALASFIFLVLLALCVVFGPLLVGELATKSALRLRNAPPGSFELGWVYALGADNLGRPMVARLIVGAQNTIGIAVLAGLSALTLGGILGLVAGYFGGWIGNLIMRLTDIVMSFPSLLLALVVLFVLGPSVFNLIIVLAITRTPVYVRTTRAEVLELRQRMFVSAAQVMGAGNLRIIARHIVPLVLPTLITIASVDFASIILTESGLSFLGLGIQPPAFSWGAMVANGRSFLQTAWWLSVFPGIMIILATLSLTLLSSWLRTVNDPQQRWRLEGKRSRRK